MGRGLGKNTVRANWPVAAVVAICACLAWHPQPVSAADKAGVSAAVRGTVGLTPVTGGGERPAQSGEDVFLGDAIRTDVQSGMQLLLLDRSTFTVGENTELTVDEFVYDPNTGAGKLSASFAKGAFRFVSGLVSKDEPEAVSLQLPVAAVGVRGTAISVMDTPAGTLVILEGPGQENNAQERQGVVTVTANGKSVTLSRPGYAVLVTPEGEIVGPFPVTDDQWAALAGFLEAGAGTTYEVGIGDSVKHASDPVVDSDERTASGLEAIEIVLEVEDLQKTGLDLQPDEPFETMPMDDPMDQPMDQPMDDPHDDDDYDSFL